MRVAAWPSTNAAASVISGGLGDLGLEVASFLVEELGARNLALVGRSAPGERALGVIEALRGFGARIELLRADVSNAAGMGPRCGRSSKVCRRSEASFTRPVYCTTRR